MSQRGSDRGDSDRSGERKARRKRTGGTSTSARSGGEVDRVTDGESRSDRTVLSTASTARDRDRWSRRRIVVFVVGFLLLSTVAGANVAVAADRTVLSSDHVVATMDERGVFTDLTAEFRAVVATETAAATADLDLPPGVTLVEFDPDDVAARSVSESYVRGEVVANLERLYAFLYGDVDDLEMTVDLRPVKSAIAETVTGAVVIDTATFVGETSDDVEAERIAALEEDEESFAEAQLDLPDERVETRKGEIEAEIRAAGHPEELAEALVTLQFTVVDGLTGELTFEEYNERLERAEADVSGALGSAAVAEVDDTVALETNGEDLAKTFDGMRTPVQLTSTLVWVLPFVALGLVGALVRLTDSLSRALSVTGVALLGAVGVCAVAWLVLRQQAADLFEDHGMAEGVDTLLDGFLAVVGTMFDALAVQSILLTVTGLVLLGTAATDYGSLDELKPGGTADDSAGTADGADESAGTDAGEFPDAEGSDGAVER